ncbi:Alpha/beta hydrolase family protein [Roseimaritima multifibrata]|uniref:Alpha/beta hydrolase family protein n=1 Tax=Roseimaritima multifibrata TaxID=1930274 RepID=A0A517MK41_9BACT|nr:alpha/beta fold hydrolase [Roseimaritima multifibrata]QDS95210.1 Alpha/beta hydrolase family protein [Roseimaritima multifibrata]
MLPAQSPSRSSWQIAVATGLLWACVIGLTSGCTTTRYISKRHVRENALNTSLNLMRWKGPSLSERTSLQLTRFGLLDQYEKDPKATLEKLQQMAMSQDQELTFAVGELSYVEGVKAERAGIESTALHHYGMAMSNSYQYLFAADLDATRNPYDPQFREACELYNESLEDMLRLLCAENKLRPGQNYTIETPERTFTIDTVARGKWPAAEFERYEFVSDYKVETLHNRHVTYGLGVPLLAVRRPKDGDPHREKYYPDGLSYAVTALLRCTDIDRKPGEPPKHCVLEFFDPLSHNHVELANRWVPLETDLTTPLAYYLDSPQFRERDNATQGLLNPAKSQETRGLYMLEPYDPKRIPVVMVHGLWSSPLTWMDMFNDLRSFPAIRERYQFWFYMYPSGQPFWNSATEMRADLANVRDAFDPMHHDRTMDQMVLVGHSMGGLVSRMQTIDSHQDFWNIVSNQPVQELQGPSETKAKLASALFFKPNQSVQRVVTIATPHRGSDFANDYTRWLARKFIRLPRMAVNTGTLLAARNPGFFKDTKMLTTSNAIDSLAPESPIFPVMMRAQESSEVKLHNIVGLVEKHGLFGRIIEGSDGIVEFDSAHLENADSEIVVNSDHTSVHTKSQTILEVRRILLEHMAELDATDRVADAAGNELAAGGAASYPAAGPIAQLHSPQVADSPNANLPPLLLRHPSIGSTVAQPVVTSP